MANKDKRNRKGYGEILLDPWIFVPLIIVVFEVAMILFLRHKFVAGIEYDFWGIFGDFFGGVIGTFLTFVSVLILAKTFEQQQESTNANIKQQKIQRFNDSFYELLNLYKEQVKGLSFENEGKCYQGKEFFDICKDIVQKKYNRGKKQAYSSYRQEAKSIYIQFYEENKSKFAPYFRMLYRILEIISENKDLEDAQKDAYSKIIRAQLTESELFFLKYNAMTFYGANFIEYLNRFDILKHLPITDLIEFREYNKKCAEYKAGINAVFFDIIKTLEYVLENPINCKAQQIEIQTSRNSKKYKFYIELKEENEIEIKLLEDEKISKNTKYEFEFIEKLKKEDIVNILMCFANEIFKFANFVKFNSKNMTIMPNKDGKYSSGGNKSSSVIVRNSGKQPRPIQIKYNHKKE